MRLFAILVRCIVVGAICIVASAIYIANVDAVERVTIVKKTSCPSDAVDGITDYRCLRWGGSAFTVVNAVENGVLITATVTCNAGDFIQNAYRLGVTGSFNGGCWPSAGGPPYQAAAVGLSWEAPPSSTSTTLFVIGNVFVFLAAISFGWRMSIRPPVGIME